MSEPIYPVDLSKSGRWMPMREIIFSEPWPFVAVGAGYYDTIARAVRDRNAPTAVTLSMAGGAVLRGGPGTEAWVKK